MRKNTQLDLPKRVGITNEAHIKLRYLRRLHKKSMAQITINLIDKEYESITKTN